MTIHFLRTLLIILFCSLTSHINAQWQQIGNNIEGDRTYEYFGRAMTLSSDGSTLAIGSQANPENAFLSIVRLLKETDGEWHQFGNDIEASSGDNSDAISLSSDGSRVAIGSIRNGVVDGNANYDGHVRIFEYSDENWIQIGDDILGTGGENAGSSLSLNSDGNILAVGAHFNDENGTDAGQIRVYQELNGEWQQMGDLIDGDIAFDNFGFSIDINPTGDIIAVGAPFNNNNNGQVKIYSFVDNNWQQIGEDILGGPLEVFGYSVSLNNDGSIIAISAIEIISTETGFVSIYKNKDGNWEQIGDNIPGQQVSGLFGVSVSLSENGNVVAIGGSTTDGDFSGSGKIQIFENIDDTWNQVDQDITGLASEDNFGHIVSLSADGSVLAGSGYLNDDNGFQAGHVRIFQNENIVSLNELPSSEINIYPNPSQGVFIFENAVNYKLNIWDIQGKLLFSTAITEQHAAVHLENLHSGIYFAQLQSDKHHTFVKLFVD